MANVTCKLCNQKFESRLIQTLKFSKTNAVGMTETCPHCAFNTLVDSTNLED
ncbi:MAG: hypothetical protein JW891_04330 [Candidatus Lokiarchaeota archaeon]|nr:hypothetical protein [Candidatus Lokiarchaeota archaeon]